MRSEVNQSEQKVKSAHHFFVGLHIVILGFVALGVYGVILYEYQMQDRVPYGVFFGEISLFGKKRDDVLSIVENFQTRLDQGIHVTAQDTTHIVYPKFVGVNADLEMTLISVDTEVTVERTMRIGHQGTWWDRLRSHVLFAIRPIAVEADVAMNRPEIEALLQSYFGKLENPGKDAELLVMSDLSFGIQPESLGQSFHFYDVTKDLLSDLRRGTIPKVQLALSEDLPKITTQDAAGLLGPAENIVRAGLPQFTFDGKEWEVPEETFRTWLGFEAGSQRSEQSAVLSQTGVLGATASRAQIGLRPDRIALWLEQLSGEVEIPSQEAKFMVENGRVREFQPSRTGRELSQEETFERLKDAVLVSGKYAVEIAVAEKRPQVETSQVNDLGIKEVLGVGQSNFSGSPQNRQHNIRLGAGKIDGTLVAPGGEFSLLKTLGDFDASQGWLPELVIKGDRTVPEYGGGACQFGTTVFRATLESGMPVLERRNHSYVVGYYVDQNGLPGTDATIYNPAPDYRFQNDTANWILIDTEIVDTTFTVTFWGTSDGRKAERSATRIGGWVNPPPTKIIETEDLAPGEKKCIEKSHRGTTAAFDYRITYPDGRVAEETFTSKYKPWQEVCLVGKEKVAQKE